MKEFQLTCMKHIDPNASCPSAVEPCSVFSVIYHPNNPNRKGVINGFFLGAFVCAGYCDVKPKDMPIIVLDDNGNVVMDRYDGYNPGYVRENSTV